MSFTNLKVKSKYWKRTFKAYEGLIFVHLFYNKNVFKKVLRNALKRSLSPECYAAKITIIECFLDFSSM